MTCMPASRRARATTLMPRSWPSSPTLASTTRIGRVDMASLLPLYSTTAAGHTTPLRPYFGERDRARSARHEAAGVLSPNDGPGRVRSGPGRAVVRPVVGARGVRRGDRRLHGVAPAAVRHRLAERVAL